MKVAYAVYGASGFGKEVIPLLKAQITNEGNGEEHIYFVDDSSSIKNLNGYPVIDLNSFLKLPFDKFYISIAIANSKVRQQLTKKCLEKNLNLIDVMASNAIVLDQVDIGEGAILCPFTMLTSNIKIGKQFHSNIYSYVGHDCIIGNYVTFAPAVKCNGNVIIGDHVYIGTGAIIKQGRPGRPLKIGKGAIIGAGAFVTKNVPENMTVFGNPAIEFTKENLRKRNG